MSALARLLRPWRRRRAARRARAQAERLWAALPDLATFQAWHPHRPTPHACPRCGHDQPRARPLHDPQDPRRVATCTRCDLPLHRSYAATAAAGPAKCNPFPLRREPTLVPTIDPRPPRGRPRPAP